MVDGQNWTPITLAIETESIESFKILIQNNMPVNGGHIKVLGEKIGWIISSENFVVR